MSETLPNVDADSDPAATASLNKRVALAGARGMIGQVAATIAALAATPFVIRLLGSDSYGLLSLIQAFIGYLSFADLGMGFASSRFAAGAYAAGDDAEEVAVIWTSLVVCSAPATAFAVLLGLGAPTIAHQVMHLSPHLAPQGITALRIAGLGFVARAFQGVLNTSLLVRLRWGTYTLVNTGTNIGQIVMTPIVLALGGGVVAAAVVITSWAWLSTVGIFVTSALVQRKLARPVVRRRLLKPLMQLGGAVVVTAICTPILADIDRVILAHFDSVRLVAYYSVAASVAMLLLIIPNTLYQPLFAGMSLFLATDQREKAAELFLRTLRVLLLFAFPICTVLIAIGRPAIAAWAGPVYGRKSTLAMYILLPGVFGQIVATIAVQVLTAGHRARTAATILAAEIPLYVASDALVIHLWGITGCAVAWTARNLLSAAVMVAATRKVVPLRVPRPWSLFRRLVVSAVVAIGPVVAGVALGASDVFDAILGLVALAAYAAVTWRSVLRPEEKQWVVSHVRSRRMARLDHA